MRKAKIIDNTSKLFFLFNKLYKNKLKLKKINISLFKPDVKKFSDGINNVMQIAIFWNLSKSLIKDSNKRHDEKDIKNVAMFKDSNLIL